MISRTPHASGFAAMAALFLLVVLAALGAFMLSFSNTQQLNAAQDIQGSRAYWAARAGLDWALAAIAANRVCPAPASVPASVDTGAVFKLSLVCTPRSYLEGSATVTIFVIDSVATTGTLGSLGYVERSVTAAYEVAQ
jgi:MSHA biogenesis protein MshP